MRLEVSKRTLYYIILLFFILCPGRLSTAFLPYSSYIFILAQALIGLLFLRQFGMVFPNSSVGKWMFIFLITCSLGIFINNGMPLLTVVRYICWIISLLGLYVYFQNASKEDAYFFLEAAKFLWVFTLLLTFYYSRFINADTAYGSAVYFWGSEAVTVQYFVMFMATSLYFDLEYKNKITKTTIICSVLSFAFSVINTSGQGMSMIGLLVICVILNEVQKEKLWKIISPIPFILVIAVLNYLIITLKYKDIVIVIDYITNVLGKDPTLTGRDQIFQGAIGVFVQHPFVGYGYNNSIINDTLGKIAMQFNTAHNSMLQLMVDYGLIGLASFVMMMYTSLNKITKIQKKSNAICYFALLASFFGALVNMMIPTITFWIVLFLGLRDSEDELRWE